VNKMKMLLVSRRVAGIFSTILLAVVCSTSFAQTSTSVNADANRRWVGFWRQFTVAVNKKDRDAIKKMMPDDFFDGGGGLTPSEWLRFIDENERNGSWKDLQRSVATGTVKNRKWSSKGIPTKVTRDNRYYFEFRKGRWLFAGVVGD
jgi:hypothetical protein